MRFVHTPAKQVLHYELPARHQQYEYLVPAIIPRIISYGLYVRMNKYYDQYNRGGTK